MDADKFCFPVDSVSIKKRDLYDVIVGPVAQRITRLPTEQKIPGSNPGRIALLLRKIKAVIL